jgi:hypothetical protein
MSKRVTAVEWLADQIQEQLNVFLPGGVLCETMLIKAKQMEREQIIEAYKSDLHPCSDEDAEQYYNETFKSE